MPTMQRLLPRALYSSYHWELKSHTEPELQHRNLPKGQFAKKSNTLDVKVWQSSWAPQCRSLKNKPTQLSQLRKYCTCGFVVVLGNSLNRPRYRKKYGCMAHTCAILARKQEDLSKASLAK